MRCDWKPTEYASPKGHPMFVCSRPACRRHGFAKSVEDFAAVKCRQGSIGLGDLAYAGIAGATLGISTLIGCGKCSKRRQRWNAVGLTPPSWLWRLLGLARPLPWHDPHYAARLKKRKVQG